MPPTAGGHRTPNPPPGRGPAVISPPNTLTRSRMPGQAVPTDVAVLAAGPVVRAPRARSPPARSAPERWHGAPPACLSAFVSASWTTPVGGELDRRAAARAPLALHPKLDRAGPPRAPASRSAGSSSKPRLRREPELVARRRAGGPPAGSSRRAPGAPSPAPSESARRPGPGRASGPPRPRRPGRPSPTPSAQSRRAARARSRARSSATAASRSRSSRSARRSSSSDSRSRPRIARPDEPRRRGDERDPRDVGAVVGLAVVPGDLPSPSKRLIDNSRAPGRLTAPHHDRPAGPAPRGPRRAVPHPPRASGASSLCASMNVFPSGS